MAPERTPRSRGTGLPGMRNSALAAAALTSVAMFPQTSDAASLAGDDGPSRDEVQQRVNTLYDRAETDSGTYNATRAMSGKQRQRGEPAPGRRTRDTPGPENVTRQWFDVARSKLGPTVPAALPADRKPEGSSRSRAQRPAGRSGEGRGDGRQELDYRVVAELLAGSAKELPPAGRTPELPPGRDGASASGPLELTAGPAAALLAAPGSGRRATPALPAPAPAPAAESGQSPLRTSKEQNQRKLAQARALLSRATGQQSAQLPAVPSQPTGDAWPTSLDPAQSGQFPAASQPAASWTAEPDLTQSVPSWASPATWNRPAEPTPPAQLPAVPAQPTTPWGTPGDATQTGQISAATQTGQFSAATQTGQFPAVTQTGQFPAVTQTGQFPAATQTGQFPAVTQTGQFPAVTQTGQFPAVTQTGQFPVATQTGQFPTATQTGQFPAAAQTAAPAAWGVPMDPTQSGPLPVVPSHHVATWSAPAQTAAPAAQSAVSAQPAPVVLQQTWQAQQPVGQPVYATAQADWSTGTLPAVAPAAAQEAAAQGNTAAARAIAFARAQTGKPCVWGATGPDSYDAASLIRAAWKAGGVTLPRTVPEQAGTGRQVGLTVLEPGDLIFFYDNLAHVGLYTGNGMMIHAPGPGTYIREESVYFAGESAIRGAIRPA